MADLTDLFRENEKSGESLPHDQRLTLWYLAHRLKVRGQPVRPGGVGPAKSSPGVALDYESIVHALAAEGDALRLHAGVGEAV